MMTKTGLGKNLVLAVWGVLLFGSGCASVTREEIFETRRINAAHDSQLFKDSSAQLTQALTLEKALEFALEHNLTMWMAEQERKIQNELLTSSYLKMLPQLELSKEYSRANRFQSTSSQSILNDTESLGSSYSQEKVKDTFSVGAVWNILDFGVSYLKSSQQAKELHIAENELRRTRQKLVMDVTVTYWNAQAASEAGRIAANIGAVLERQRAVIKMQMDNKALSRMEGLKAETTILKRQRILRKYGSVALQQKLELARLIGLPVSSDYELADSEFDSAGIKTVAEQASDLEEFALRNRPELYSKDLEEAITHDEALATLIQMFPAPSVFFKYNNDQNKFLYHKDWTRVGVTAAWDIFAIPSKIYERSALEKRGELFQKERMAMAVGILAQLHIALIEYEQQRMQLEFAQEISYRDASVVALLENGRSGGSGSEQDLLEQKLQYLQSRSEYLTAYADTKGAYARILNTIGVEPAGRGQLIMPGFNNDVVENEVSVNSSIEVK